jgi:fructose transport system ATP-binding protein
MSESTTVLEAQGLVKVFGRVVGLRGGDVRLRSGEVLAVIGDNGAGKSTLIKCLSGAMQPDRGTIKVDGQEVQFRSTQDAREAGIETVYQTLAVAPALDIASNLFLARELRRPGPAGKWLRMLDTKAMKEQAEEHIKSLGITTLQNINQAVETLSGGQRQVVAVARTGAFGSKVAILDEPTAALGVRETGQVLRLVKDLKEKGLGVILISHNMPNVFEVADRIHVQRLGGRAAVITPQSHSMEDAVAIMTGAKQVPEDEQALA